MLTVGDALRYYAPSPALAPYVTVIFAWNGAFTPFAEWMPAIDGQLAIRLEGAGAFEFADGNRVVPAPVALVGALSGSVRLHTGAGFHSIGAGLSAAGWRALVGARAAELADRVTDVAGLWGDRAAGELHHRLLAASSAVQRVAVLEMALLARIAGRAADWRERAMDRWIATSSLSVDTLAPLLDLGPRQAARFALERHGFSPKLLAMKHRALRAATRLAAGVDGDWTDFGYADQSHMIRDFKRFIGATPGRFVRQELACHVFDAPERVGAHLSHVGAPATG